VPPKLEFHPFCGLRAFSGADRLAGRERRGRKSELWEPLTISGLEGDMHNGTVVHVSSNRITLPVFFTSLGEFNEGGIRCPEYGLSTPYYSTDYPILQEDTQ
jgi:hypothetical protein